MSPFYDPDDVDEEEDDYIEDDEGTCEECGCSDDGPCLGGCIWVTPTRCSRCVE